MAQNIYDDPDFFAAYSRLNRQVHGLDGAPEWPALQELLPSLAETVVLDLGCGFGWFSRWAADQGAILVNGVDLSENMLARARSMTATDTIAYKRADLETIELPSDRYDLVFSSLTFHYINDIGRLFEQTSTTLRAGGALVFSVEHPIYSAASNQQVVGLDDGRRVWPLEDYLVEGRRTGTWMVDGVEKHHRTVGAHLNALIQAGLVIDRVVEWGVPDGDERHRPWFLLVAAHKP